MPNGLDSAAVQALMNALRREMRQVVREELDQKRINIAPGVYAGAFKVERNGLITAATGGGQALTWTVSRAWGEAHVNAGTFIYVMDVDRRLSGRGNGGLGFYASIPPGTGKRAALNVYVSLDGSAWSSIFATDDDRPQISGTSSTFTSIWVFKDEAGFFGMTPTAHPTAFMYIPQGAYVRLDLELVDPDADDPDAPGALAEFQFTLFLDVIG